MLATHSPVSSPQKVETALDMKPVSISGDVTSYHVKLLIWLPRVVTSHQQGL